MNRFALIVVVLVALVCTFAPSPAHAQQEVIASWPAFGDSVYLRSDATFKRAMQMLMKKEQAVFSYPESVAATDSQTLDGDTSFVFITMATGNTANVVTVSTDSAELGQILYIFNDSATAASILGEASIATCSASGGVAHLIYASGSWRMIEDQ